MYSSGIPMILKDIAQDINMDISTISRVCNGKYVQMPWGIRELKSFFSEGIKMKNGKVVSSTVVKNNLKAIQEELHNALADCYYQAKCIQSTFKHFGVKK